jgi:hypothetical protein
LSEYITKTRYTPDRQVAYEEDIRSDNMGLTYHLGDILHVVNIEEELIVKDITINYKDGSKTSFARKENDG